MVLNNHRVLALQNLSYIPMSALMHSCAVFLFRLACRIVSNICSIV